MLLVLGARCGWSRVRFVVRRWVVREQLIRGGQCACPSRGGQFGGSGGILRGPIADRSCSLVG